MYDRETDSEWKQSLGECIAGPLAGASLSVLPAALVEYGTFERDHDGVVLQPPGGESEAAGPGAEPTPVEYDGDPYGRPRPGRASASPPTAAGGRAASGTARTSRRRRSSWGWNTATRRSASR